MLQVRLFVTQYYLTDLPVAVTFNATSPTSLQVMLTLSNLLVALTVTMSAGHDDSCYVVKAG